MSSFGARHPVTLRAPVMAKDVDRLYSQIDVLLALSVWPESFGLVSREAVFYETWVIASNLGAIGQDISDGSQGSVIGIERSEELVSVLSQIDSAVAKYKERPQKSDLREAARQLDEIVLVYRDILQGQATRKTTSLKPARDPGRAAR